MRLREISFRRAAVFGTFHLAAGSIMLAMGLRARTPEQRVMAFTGATFLLLAIGWFALYANTVRMQRLRIKRRRARRCAKCGYPRPGLTNDRCPECGELASIE